MSFASLLRASPIVSLFKNQVVAPPKGQRFGEWGLKHTLRTNSRFIVVKHHDHPDTKSVHLVSGRARHDRIKIWQEIMPASMNPKSDTVPLLAAFDATQDGLPIKPFSGMSHSESLAWVKLCREKQERFLSSGREQADSWEKYISLDKIPNKPAKCHGITYDSGRESGKPWTASQSVIMVQGRVIRRIERSNFLVGIAGFVANLNILDIPVHYREIIEIGTTRSENSSTKNYNFYILDVKYLEDGSPQIKVSLSPPIYANANATTEAMFKQMIKSYSTGSGKPSYGSALNLSSYADSKVVESSKELDILMGVLGKKRG